MSIQDRDRQTADADLIADDPAPAVPSLCFDLMMTVGGSLSLSLCTAFYLLGERQLAEQAAIHFHSLRSAARAGPSWRFACDALHAISRPHTRGSLVEEKAVGLFGSLETQVF